MLENHKILAIIPARGGSKGVPRKNIRLLAGKPLIYWTISTALNTECLDRVIVSTDDSEIAEKSKEYGAEVPFLRPVEYAQDQTSDYPVYYHTLKWLKENEDYEPDIVVWLRPTTPLRKKNDIEEAIQLYTDTKPDWVRSVCSVEHHPYWMFSVDDDFNMEPFIEGIDVRQYLRRQSLPSVYRINGVIDVTRPSLLKDSNKLYCGKLKAYIMPIERSIDIDTEKDFMILENLFSLKNGVSTHV